MATITIHVDGCCEPSNPGGYACWGWIATGPSGKLLRKDSGCVARGPEATNNRAEYAALLAALAYCHQQQDLLTSRSLSLLIRADSQLVVNQVNGPWSCNSPTLLPLCNEAKRLLRALREAGISVDLEWIPRIENAAADALSRQAYQRARAGGG